ncbi:MAG: TlpA family protein disulfide reductase, partial [Bacteroidaceae bacterium]|nr:TlpA family protein disulfide reductase [Bacteroidaceae bacterium]
KNVIKQYDVTGDNVVHYNLPADQQSAVEQFVGVNGYPTYRLIDRNGNLVDVNVDARSIDVLKKVLNKIK